MAAVKPSRSALGAAEARGTHRLWDPPPHVLDDAYALDLIGPEWVALAAESRAMAPPEVTRAGRAGVVVRTRYAEDRLLSSPSASFAQYVVLGAGLDSFAWRRADLLDAGLVVVEVDAPATQRFKRERAAALALPVHANHRFLPLDFEAQPPAALDRGPVTLFSCVGVAMYLTPDALATLLRAVAGWPSGSEIALGYNVADAYLDDIGRAFLGAVTRRLGEDEPLRSALAPDETEALVADCGLVVVDHPTADDLAVRYGVRPYTLERLLTARVP